jgi:hypothetical protein
MAGRERAIGVRAAEPSEDEHFSEVDEREARRAPHDVLHEKRYALRVIDHPTHAEPGARLTRDTFAWARVLAASPRGAY